jgi:hypothetical protein
VSSAIRCCTSCTAGRESRLKRAAPRTTNGTGSRASTASQGLIAIITTLASAIVSAFWVRKMSP